MSTLEIPQGLREVLSTHTAHMTTSPTFASALAYVRAGYRVLPCTAGEKRPHTTEYFRHGARSATTNFELIRDHWYEHPDDNVGWASDGSIVFLDIDPRNGGSLDTAVRLGLPIDGYRERTAGGDHHIPLIMPSGTFGSKSTTLAPGVEIKSAGSYVVSAHSVIGDSWYRPEAERDVWAFGVIPDTWDRLDAITGPANFASNTKVITNEDMAEAERVKRQLLASTDYSLTIHSILFGGWSSRYPSRSEADAALALMATHFLRGHTRREEIVTALLCEYSLKSEGHANPPAYISSVVHAAESARDAREAARLSYFVRSFMGGDTGDAFSMDCVGGVMDDIITMPPGLPVYDPKFQGISRRGRRARDIQRVILTFATWADVDEYTHFDGWRRFPVNLAALAFRVTPEAIRQHLKALEKRGQIERRVVTKRHDGRPRRDSLIRPGSHYTFRLHGDSFQPHDAEILLGRRRMKPTPRWLMTTGMEHFRHAFSLDIERASSSTMWRKD